MRPPVIDDIEVDLAGIVVRVAARSELQVLDVDSRVVGFMAVFGEDVDYFQNRAVAIDDPDVRAEAATDIEDVLIGVVGQRLGILDFRGQRDGREELRAGVVDLDNSICAIRRSR